MHIHIFGEYTAAALYNYAAEETRHVGCEYKNDAGDGVIVSADNVENVTSPYVTILSGVESTNGFYFSGGKLRSRADDSTSAALRVRGGDSVVIRDSITMSNGGSFVHVNSTPQSVAGFKLDNGRFHPTEGILADVGVVMDGGNNIDDPRIEDTALQAANEVLNLASDTEIRGDFAFRPGKYINGDAPVFEGDVCLSVSSWAEIYHTQPNQLANTTLYLGNFGGELYAPSGDYNVGALVDGSQIFDGNSAERQFDGPLRTGADNGDSTVFYGPNGARITVEGGELVAYDEAGNSTTLT
jgi:hypothetical protein